MSSLELLATLGLLAVVLISTAAIHEERVAREREEP